jgi:hypothetical protein
MGSARELLVVYFDQYDNVITEVPAGLPAPTFAVQGTDGNPTTLAALTADGRGLVAGTVAGTVNVLVEVPGLKTATMVVDITTGVAAQVGMQRSLFPAVWELFPFVLAHKLRADVYEPAYEELREDFVRAQQYKGTWEKRWIVFAFTVRTVLLVLECLRVAAGERVMRALGGLAREFIRRFLHMG